MNISEVSKKYGLSADTLRYYEKQGLIPSVQRTDGGIRDYTPSDCNWVEFAKCMRGAGLPVDTLAEYVRLYGRGNRTLQQRKNLLIRERDLLQQRLDELSQTLARLNHKIENYDNQIVACEKKLLK